MSEIVRILKKQGAKNKIINDSIKDVLEQIKLNRELKKQEDENNRKLKKINEEKK